MCETAVWPLLAMMSGGLNQVSNKLNILTEIVWVNRIKVKDTFFCYNIITQQSFNLFHPGYIYFDLETMWFWIIISWN